MTDAVEPQMTGPAKAAFAAIGVGLVLFSLYTAMFGGRLLLRDFAD